MCAHAHVHTCSCMFECVCLCTRTCIHVCVDGECSRNLTSVIRVFNPLPIMILASPTPPPPPPPPPPPQALPSVTGGCFAAICTQACQAVLVTQTCMCANTYTHSAVTLDAFVEYPQPVYFCLFLHVCFVPISPTLEGEAVGRLLSKLWAVLKYVRSSHFVSVQTGSYECMHT